MSLDESTCLEIRALAPGRFIHQPRSPRLRNGRFAFLPLLFLVLSLEALGAFASSRASSSSKDATAEEESEHRRAVRVVFNRFLFA